VIYSTKIEKKYKSPITRLVYKINRSLPLSEGFRGWAIEWCQTNYTTIDPCCHDNESWQNRLQFSVCRRYLQDPSV